MSRRGALTQRQAQIRAASRMTPGTRMWSEQPLVDHRGRWVLGKVPPIEGPPIMYPPYSLQYIKYQGGAPQSYYVTLAARQQAVFVCSAPPGQPMTIGYGWIVLDDETYGNQRTIVVTRTALANETTLVVSTPGKTFLWNELGMAGFVLTPDTFSQQQYKFTLAAKWQTIGNGVTLHPWSGPESNYRMRCLTARGLYNNWEGANGDESGHYQLQMGLLSPQSTFYHPYGVSDAQAYLTQDWNSGTWSHSSIGAAGACHWTEHHIQLAPR